MKNLLTFTLSVLAALVVAMLVSQPNSAVQKSVYETVLERGTLRCGYFEEPPFTVRDPNTGAMSGLAVDLMQSIADGLGLKLEWAEPVVIATFVQDTLNKRYDAVCSSVFMSPRGGKMDYTTPYAFAPVYAVVRADDTRFDKPWDQIDWANTRIAIIDGAAVTEHAQKRFPSAQYTTLPGMSQITDMLLSVGQNKADIGFVMRSVFADYNKANPGQLKIADTGSPLYTTAIAFGLRPEEPGFKNMLDMMLEQKMASGELNRLFDKYDPEGHFMQPEELAED
ncbi:MAG: substrate-binding periplasmic protein [Bdellovibrionales bacterium]